MQVIPHPLTLVTWMMLILHSETENVEYRWRVLKSAFDLVISRYIAGDIEVKI